MNTEDYNNNGSKYIYYPNGTAYIFIYQAITTLGKFNYCSEISFTKYGDVLHSKSYFTDKEMMGVGWYYPQNMRHVFDLMNQFGINY